MLVDDKLAKEKLARVALEHTEVGIYQEVLENVASEIRNTDLTDCAPDQGSVRDATELAKLFHDTYERLAPSFGYVTRTDTRQFDPESPNGRLMIAVCEAIRALPDQKD